MILHRLFPKKKHEKPISESVDTSNIVAPHYFVMCTDREDNPRIELCWNQGWPPYEKYIHIHDIFYSKKGSIFFGPHEKEDIQILLENFLDSIRCSQHEIRGCYIKDWMFRHHTGLWILMGFSPKITQQTGIDKLHLNLF